MKINKETEKALLFVLFMQNVAGARNVKPMKRLEALHLDIGLVIQGKQPTNSKALI